VDIKATQVTDQPLPFNMQRPHLDLLLTHPAKRQQLHPEVAHTRLF
jgi:hypothetical protein